MLVCRADGGQVARSGTRRSRAAPASNEQIDRYLRPALRGELKDAYAVTERDAGSDPSAIVATAERPPAGFRLTAEKWFVTAGDVASVYIVMANVVEGSERLPTL